MEALTAHGHTIRYAPRVTHGYQALWCVETVTPPAWFACLGRALAWCAQWPNAEDSENAPQTRQETFWGAETLEAA